MSKVSHHPPISALYVTNRKDGFTLLATILAKLKFYGTNYLNSILILGIFEIWNSFFYFVDVWKGNSLSALLDGSARLTLLPRGEDYIITMPYAHCKVTYSPFISNSNFNHLKNLLFSDHHQGILLGSLTLETVGDGDGDDARRLVGRLVLDGRRRIV